jgi:AraC-like DNA-binding protein
MKKRTVVKGAEALRETFRQAYKVQMDMHFEHVAVQNKDEKFLIDVVEYIKRNMSSPELSVEALSREMKMSRVSLYRKILTFAGKSPVEFVRAIRLQKAVQLLENSQMGIGRIACEVGFNNAHYFSKLFKKEYNILPSTYIHFSRKAKAEAPLDDYALTAALKNSDYSDSGMPNQKP